MAIPISADFVEKYNQPGPRYTSYPTVPAWEPGFDEGDYRAALTGFRRIAETYPKSDEAVRAAYWSGRSLLELKEYPAAAQVLKRFAGEHPESPVALDGLFWCA